MFEPLPEKPSQFALHKVGLVAIFGGIVGLVAGAFVFGQQGFQNDWVMIGSFVVGAFAGGLWGWRLVMPRSSTPSE